MRKMNTNVRVIQRTKKKVSRNPTSGHEWVEETLISTWDVVGCLGVISSHKSERKAEEVAKDWQEFYDRHPFFLKQ